MERKEFRFRKGLGRLIGAWLVLARSRRALFGIGIIVFFVFVAVLAPSLATLSCGFECHPTDDRLLAHDHAAPAWFRTLGLQGGLSGNLALEQKGERGFNSPDSVSGWRLATSHPGIVSFEYSSTIGRDAPGSVGVVVTPRLEGSVYGTITITMERELPTYPYDGSPGRFFGNAEVLLDIPGIDLTIAGIAPSGGTGLKVDSRIRFVDSNSNSLWNSPETIVLDFDSDGLYDLADLLIFGSTAPRVNSPLTSDPRMKYYDTNGNNVRDFRDEEVLIYDTDLDSRYDSPPRVQMGAFIFQDFNRIRYFDVDGNDVWDSGETVVFDRYGSGTFDFSDIILAGSAPVDNAVLKDDVKINYVFVDLVSPEPAELVTQGTAPRDVIYDADADGVFDAGDPVIAGSAPSVGTPLTIAKPSFTLWKNDELPSNGRYPESWFVPDPPIDSASVLLKGRFFGGQGAEIHPETIVFSQKGSYTFRLTMEVRDTDPTIPLNISANIDDIELSLLGTSYGLLGTDQDGRDLFSQLAFGARISLAVGLVSAILGIVIGLAIGLLAGFKAGIVDEGLMRFTDMLLVLPGLPLLLVLVAVLGPSIWTIIGVLGFLGWMGFARVIRTQVVSIKERPFVEASRAVGSGTGHLITRHILPNVMGLTYVSLATAVPGAITAEAALSFLGLFDPLLMSWGRVLFNAQQNQGFFQWWWVLPPGFAIAILSISFILIGFALDDILNPKLRQRR